MHPDLAAQANIPNAPSEPVWSLGLHQEQAVHRQAPREQIYEPLHMRAVALKAPAEEPAPAPAPESPEQTHEPLDEAAEHLPLAIDAAAVPPAQTPSPPPPPRSAEPARKGWWQRPFRARE
jgi:hypothetical protein